jgi:hypothetical protein
MNPVNLNSGVMENIMSSMYNVDPRSTYRQLNRQIYDESKMSFYQKNCNKPISKHEIIKYINTNPKKLGIVFLDEDEDDDYFESGVKFSYLTKQFFKSAYAGEYSSINIYLNNNNNDYYVENNFKIMGTPTVDTLIDVINDEYIFDYDLLTIYNIYKNRGDCMRVYKNYAKNKVLDELVNITNNQNTFFEIYYCYEYLILNCFMFDIEEKFEELDTIRLKYETAYRSIVNFEPDEIIDYINNAMENPIDENFKEYMQLRQYMLNEIDRLAPKIISYINNNM